MYCGEITVDIDSALPLLMLSDKYNVQPLKRGFEQYMDKTVLKSFELKIMFECLL